MTGLLRSDVSVFRRARSIIAESLWWDGTAMRWCDIDAGLVYRSPLAGDADGSNDETLLFPPPVSAFQPLASADGIVISGADFVAIAGPVGEIPKVVAHVEHHSGRLRFNEAKCDPAGRFIAGSMSLDNELNGAIYSITEAGQVRILIGGVGVANGFEWSDDGRTMWFTDTATTTIYRGDYSAEGELHNVEPFVHGRMSDGLARDEDGGFWNGIYDSGHVVHWNSDGIPDLEFNVPGVHVTSVAFGGPERSTLFIATARENCTEQQLVEHPLTGSIFQVETTAHGYPVRAFGTPQKGS
jgi:sugar lactone lactonase YvrE